MSLLYALTFNRIATKNTEYSLNVSNTCEQSRGCSCISCDRVEADFDFFDLQWDLTDHFYDSKYKRSKFYFQGISWNMNYIGTLLLGVSMAIIKLVLTSILPH